MYPIDFGAASPGPFLAVCQNVAFSRRIEFNGAHWGNRAMWKKALFGTVSAGFLGYVVWVSCLSTARHQIEWDVATRVTSVLDRTGFSRVVAVVEGRDVELRGKVQSESEAQRAERIVSMIRGVRAVSANMLVTEDKGPHGGET